MFQLRSAHILLLAAATMMASCADDTDTPAASRAIRFQVDIASQWQTTRAQTAGSAPQSLPTVQLRSGSAALYLIPSVTPAAGDATASRAAAVTSEEISSMGVYTATAGSDAYYMANVEVTRDGGWAPSREYLWPGSGSLHILAYSPYVSAGGASAGITSLPSASASEQPALRYTVPSDVTEQTDLMWATPRDASSSPCPITFNHALSAVRFVAGAEMTPCTVRSVSISGLLDSGTLSLETGQWTATSGSASYTATADAKLEAAPGSQYAPAGAAITDADHTFMLLPQTLADDAAVTLSIDIDGQEMEYTASIAGQAWRAGYTYTYHLSANPAADRFIITADGPLSFNYTGGQATFQVKSVRQTLVDGKLVDEDVPWTADFVDDSGNVIDMPSWITDFPLSGTGSGSFGAATRMVEPSFVTMSEPTRRLREQPERGSEAAPYNLASSSGGAAVENTANCYVIHAPGTYSIPLVYGNAIKDGADNTAAYVPTRSSAPFVNHLNKRIKHPYIYDNDGCAPAGATLVWEGRLNMIHDLHLSADSRSIIFTIPRGYIRQGNAVVAVTDADGAIMWSWQLWVTDHVPGQDMIALTYNGSPFEIMPCNMGYVDGGDETDFASSTATVRLTQHPSDGSEGGTATLTVEQRGKHIITPCCYSFYQWGRKDPMISGIKEWYYADHTEITTIDTRIPEITGGRIEDDFDAQCVLHPQVFWVVSSNAPTYRYTNNWNLGTSTRRVKTVYDPCPAGFMVPGNEMMAFRDMADSNFTFTTGSGISNPSGFTVDTGSGQSVFFPALGYRSGNSGNETVTTASGGSLTALWTSHANTREGAGLVLSYSNSTLSHPLPTDPRTEAFAVRPIRE